MVFWQETCADIRQVEDVAAPLYMLCRRRDCAHLRDVSRLRMSSAEDCKKLLWGILEPLIDALGSVSVRMGHMAARAPGALWGGRGTEVSGFVIGDVQEVRVELDRQPEVGEAAHGVHRQIHRIQLHVRQVVQPG